MSTVTHSPLPAPQLDASHSVRDRWAVLSIGRFFLSLVVASNHLPVFISPTYNGGGILPFLQLFPGTGAVLVFFVISGYSIAASIQQEPSGFYFRRGLRILPLYWLVVLGSALIPLFFGGEIETARVRYFTPSITELMTNMFLLQGFLGDAINTDRAVWSLSVEAFLYLIAPRLVRLSSRILWLLIGASLCAFIIAKVIPEPASFYRYGGNTLTSAWSWMLGFWIYRRRGDRISLMIAGMIGCVPAFFTVPGFLVIWVGTLVAFGKADSLRLPRVGLSFCERLGDISYALYLIHIPFFTFLFALGIRGSTWSLLLLILVSYGLDRYYDQPAKRLVRRLAS